MLKRPSARAVSLQLFSYVAVTRSETGFVIPLGPREMDRDSVKAKRRSEKARRNRAAQGPAQQWAARNHERRDTWKSRPPSSAPDILDPWSSRARAWVDRIAM